MPCGRHRSAVERTAPWPSVALVFFLRVEIITTARRTKSAAVNGAELFWRRRSKQGSTQKTQRAANEREGSRAGCTVEPDHRLRGSMDAVFPAAELRHATSGDQARRARPVTSVPPPPTTPLSSRSFADICVLCVTILLLHAATTHAAAARPIGSVAPVSGRTVVRGAVAEEGRAGRGGDARWEVGPRKKHRGAVLLRVSGSRWRPGLNAAFDSRRPSAVRSTDPGSGPPRRRAGGSLAPKAVTGVPRLAPRRRPKHFGRLLVISSSYRPVRPYFEPHGTPQASLSTRKRSSDIIRSTIAYFRAVMRLANSRNWGRLPKNCCGNTE